MNANTPPAFGRGFSLQKKDRDMNTTTQTKAMECVRTYTSESQIERHQHKDRTATQQQIERAGVLLFGFSLHQEQQPEARHTHGFLDAVIGLRNLLGGELQDGETAANIIAKAEKVKLRAGVHTF